MYIAMNLDNTSTGCWYYKLWLGLLGGEEEGTHRGVCRCYMRTRFMRQHSVCCDLRACAEREIFICPPLCAGQVGIVYLNMKFPLWRNKEKFGEFVVIAELPTATGRKKNYHRVPSNF
jgi:hypothetical protein